MLQLHIAGYGDFSISHVVFDVNGTLATDGELVPGVADRLQALRKQVAVHLLTADTHGGQAAIDAALGLIAERVTPGDERAQKAHFVEKLGAKTTVTIGNGANDAGMLEQAAIGIAVLGVAVLGVEGLSRETLLAADVLVRDIHGALDLLLKPNRLVATLRR